LKKLQKQLYLEKCSHSTSSPCWAASSPCSRGVVLTWGIQSHCSVINNIGLMRVSLWISKVITKLTNVWLKSDQPDLSGHTPQAGDASFCPMGAPWKQSSQKVGANLTAWPPTGCCCCAPLLATFGLLYRLGSCHNKDYVVGIPLSCFISFHLAHEPMHSLH
jgi:hypothetical protein